MRVLLRKSALMLGVVLSASCAMLPSEISSGPDYIVAFKTSRLPAFFRWPVTTAEHGWFDVLTKTGWTRVEIMGSSSGVLVESIDELEARSDVRFGDRQVHVQKVYEGDEARVLAEQILAKAKQFPWADDYVPYPGPNSNTFVEWLSHEVPGLWLEQYGTAVGKDYPINGWVSLGTTTTRTGLELETPYLGVQAGLVEGVELHLLCMTIGVGIWPPQLKLPLLPGLPWGLAR